MESNSVSVTHEDLLNSLRSQKPSHADISPDLLKPVPSISKNKIGNVVVAPNVRSVRPASAAGTDKERLWDLYFGPQSLQNVVNMSQNSLPQKTSPLSDPPAIRKADGQGNMHNGDIKTADPVSERDAAEAGLATGFTMHEQALRELQLRHMVPHLAARYQPRKSDIAVLTAHIAAKHAGEGNGADQAGDKSLTKSKSALKAGNAPSKSASAPDASANGGDGASDVEVEQSKRPAGGSAAFKVVTREKSQRVGSKFVYRKEVAPGPGKYLPKYSALDRSVPAVIIRPPSREAAASKSSSSSAAAAAAAAAASVGDDSADVAGAGGVANAASSGAGSRRSASAADRSQSKTTSKSSAREHDGSVSTSKPGAATNPEFSYDAVKGTNALWPEAHRVHPRVPSGAFRGHPQSTAAAASASGSSMTGQRPNSQGDERAQRSSWTSGHVVGGSSAFKARPRSAINTPSLTSSFGSIYYAEGYDRLTRPSTHPPTEFDKGLSHESVFTGRTKSSSSALVGAVGGSKGPSVGGMGPGAYYRELDNVPLSLTGRHVISGHRGLNRTHDWSLTVGAPKPASANRVGSAMSYRVVGDRRGEGMEVALNDPDFARWTARADGVRPNAAPNHDVEGESLGQANETWARARSVADEPGRNRPSALPGANAAFGGGEGEDMSSFNAHIEAYEEIPFAFPVQGVENSASHANLESRRPNQLHLPGNGDDDDARQGTSIPPGARRMLGTEELTRYSSAGLAKRVPGGSFSTLTREAMVKSMREISDSRVIPPAGQVVKQATDVIYNADFHKQAHRQRSPGWKLPPNRTSLSRQWVSAAALAYL